MKISQKDKVLKILHRDGYITNFDAIQGTHGFISLRLGDTIFRLRNEGVNIDREESGYIGQTKNWKYVLKDKPKEVIEYIVRGGNEDGSDRIIRKLIW